MLTSFSPQYRPRAFRQQMVLGVVLLCCLVMASVASAQAPTWTSKGPEGGFVLALAIDPSAPTTIYAGTQYGGVFKSTDGGASWSAVNTGLPNTEVPALAIDPLTPTTVYAGTFGGVFKSADGGASWSATGLFDEFFDLVRVLAIDPLTPSTVYAATLSTLNVFWPGIAPDGVFKSTNAGASWSAGTGLTNTFVYALVIDPLTPTTVYAGTGMGGVFKSTDGGASWRAAGLPYTDVLALAIDPLTPATVYAGTGLGGVFKSTDGAASWTAANTGLINTSVRALAIDPLTPTTVYAGTHNGGVFKSTDGGASWTTANTGLTNTSVRALALDPLTPTTVYAGTYGGGVFKSIDGGGHIQHSTTLTPAQVCGLEGVVAVAGGLALKSDGTVWQWYGPSPPAPISGLSSIVAIAVGGENMALASDGTVWEWEGPTRTPHQVGNLTGVVAIAAGNSRGLAVKSDGTVWEWSSGPNSSVTFAPRQVNELNNVVAVAVSDWWYCRKSWWPFCEDPYVTTILALKGDGTVWYWDELWWAGSHMPVQLSGLSDAVAISSGVPHLALKSDGTVWQLSFPIPIKVVGLTDIKAVASGGQGLTFYDDASGWGQVADVPVARHGLALRNDGTVWAWGDNHDGQLGDGTTTYRVSPVQVSGLSEVTNIAAGAAVFPSRSISSAVRHDGKVWAWGATRNARLGDETTCNATQPLSASRLR